MGVRLLIVDHETEARSALAELLRQEGFEPLEAGDGPSALRLLDERAPAVVLADLRMPRMSGLDLLRRIRESGLDTACIAMDSRGTVEGAVEAMRLGAFTYVEKTLSFEALREVIERAIEMVRLRAEARELRGQVRKRERLHGMAEPTDEMREVFRTIAQVAPTRAFVALRGGNAAAREFAARVLHRLGTRSYGPFVSLCCAGLSGEDLEVALFGEDEDGASGTARLPGKFALADGGTLLLDDADALPAATQAKLLRTLQAGEFERESPAAPRHPDVRIVTGTRSDLGEAVRAGAFREDLYFRLSVVAVRLPDRPSAEAPALGEAPGEESAAHGPWNGARRPPREGWAGVSPELLQVIEDAAQMCDELASGERHTADEVRRAGLAVAAPKVPGSTLADLERYAILRTLEATGGSTSKAASILGISPRTIQYRMKEYLAEPAEGGGDKG